MESPPSANVSEVKLVEQSHFTSFSKGQLSTENSMLRVPKLRNAQISGSAGLHSHRKFYRNAFDNAIHVIEPGL